MPWVSSGNVGILRGRLRPVLVLPHAQAVTGSQLECTSLVAGVKQCRNGMAPADPGVQQARGRIAFRVSGNA